MESSEGVANSISDQGQPDRDAVGDAGCDRAGARGRVYGGHEPPLGRDRRRHDRRPGGRHRMWTDQDRARRRARIGSRSTTSCCASRSSSAPTPSSPGARSFAADPARVRCPRLIRASPRPYRLQARSAGGPACRDRAVGGECGAHGQCPRILCTSPIDRDRPRRARALGQAGTRRDAVSAVALVYLYVSAGIRIYSTYREARSDSTQLAALEHEHVLLITSTKRLAGAAPSKRRPAGWA